MREVRDKKPNKAGKKEAKKSSEYDLTPKQESDKAHLTSKAHELAALERFPIIYVPGFGAPAIHGLYLRSRLELEGFDVYEADLPSLQLGDVEKSAAALAVEVQRTRQKFDAEKVNLVGHSLGGIISRYYLQKLGGWKYVYRAVYLGTPHKGVYWAYLGLWAKSGRQMLPGSKLIKELNSDPSRCRAIKCLSIISNFDEMIVPRDSGILDCGYNKLVNWPIGHWGMVFSNKAVEWIVDFFDGLFDLREGFAMLGPDHQAEDVICHERLKEKVG
ncbi:MAG: alpha/beta fold hydrolase [Actinomycetota bacterium]|nr:alpha/beta fold hydrolase [Actinomycetota bacterium]